MSDSKNVAVFGIFPTVASADNATDIFVKSGFAASNISALMPENLGQRQIGTEKSTKAPEGAAAGASTGAVLGVPVLAPASSETSDVPIAVAR